MLFTEAFFILNIPMGVKTILEAKIIPQLKQTAIENIMFIEKNAEKETELSFKYSNDSPALNSVSARLTNVGCTIHRLLVHLSSELSGIRDVYDASAKGFVIQDTLKNISYIKTAATSNNGTVRIEIDPEADDYDVVVSASIKAIKNI